VDADVGQAKLVAAGRARSSPRAWLTYVRLVGVIAALVAFLWLFDTSRNQPLVDGLWALALILWVRDVKARSRGPLIGVRPQWGDILPVAVILPVFAAAWLPFYDNWRWAYTGDSFGVFCSGYWLAKNGLTQNILSVHGIDNSFTVLWGVAYNALMMVFGPTLFWHRCGNLIMSCLALASIYTFFALVVGRYWGVAIMLATAINYVWLWFTYVSYGKIDSFIFYFLTLSFATLAWRRPDRLGVWMWCGLTGGLSLFFTPTAWSGVIFASVGLGVFALVTRRFGALAVFAVSFVVMAVPILQELPWFITMTRQQTQQALEWSYVAHIFRTIVLLPYDSPICRLGVNGAFLRWPLGFLYFGGIGLAALATIPPLRRWLRVPAIAPTLLALLLWDAVLLSLTNKGYADPSQKRVYNLIPLQVFFALVPAYVLYAWSARARWGRRAVAVLVAAMLAVYARTNLWLIIFPEPAVYGLNVFDGIIELRQRFPERRVLLMTQREGLRAAFEADGIYQTAYKILDNLTFEQTFADSTVAHACAQHAVLCYEPAFDQERMQPLLDSHRSTLEPFPLLNSVELVCYECPTVPVPRR
jgi:hypothetical protein